MENIFYSSTSRRYNIEPCGSGGGGWLIPSQSHTQRSSVADHRPELVLTRLSRLPLLRSEVISLLSRLSSHYK